jgi:PAS domain S-box-containing protein
MELNPHKAQSVSQTKWFKRKRTGQALKHRLEIEEIITAISSSFLRVTGDELDAEINLALQKVGQFARADRCFVDLYADDLSQVTKSYEWWIEGLEPLSNRFPDISLDVFPWSLARLKKHEILQFTSLDDLPPEAEGDKAFWLASGMKSQVAIPMISGSALVGFFGFSSDVHEKSWLAEDIQILRLVGDLIMVMLERKRAADSLRRSESLYQDILETAYEGVWISDVDGRITFANQRIAEMLGYSVDEIIGCDLYRFMDEDWRETARKKYEQRRLGVKALYDFRFSRKDGSSLWAIISATPLLDKNGKFTGSFAMITDITGRKRAEEELRASEARLRAIFEYAGIGIALVNPEGQIVENNPALANMIGYSDDELHKITFMDFTHPEDLKADVDLFHAMLAGKLTSFQMEKRYIRKDGQVLWGRLTSSAVKNGDGAPNYVIGMVEDVSARKRAEEAIKQSEERFRQLAYENAHLLNQAQRDAEIKTILLREVNHRVKNNLTSIIGLLAAERRFTPSSGRSFVNNAIENISRRIEGLLEIHTLLSETGWGPVNLSQIAEQIVLSVLKTLPAGRRITVSVDPSPVEISPRQANNLALVITELATNTIKHSLNERRATWISIQSWKKGNLIHLEYRDNGPGYPEDVLRMERYNVGLYLIQRLAVQTLRGTLQLANNDGAIARLVFQVEEKDRT